MNGKAIPYGKQTIDEKDIQAVVDVLQSDFLTQGPHIATFEKNFAEYVGAKYAVAVANGTAALHLAALCLDTSKKVIAPPLSFVASTNCIEYVGGEIEFVDIDPDSWLIDVKKVEALLTKSPNAYSGIIAVNFAGKVCDFEALKKLADQYGLWIMEDACHSPGGKTTLTKTKSGSGELMDISVFSFHPVKHIACGEGGMITTNNESYYKQLLQLRTHGITREQDLFSNDLNLAGGQTDFPLWYMEMQSLGYNYRLTDLQAALGNSQLSKAEAGLKRRREIAKMYNDHFSKSSYIKKHSGFQEEHAYHLYVILVEDRLELYNYLRSKNIFAQIHYFPIHLMPYYSEKGWKKGDFPEVENYYEQCLSLPMFPALTNEEIQYVLATIDAFYEK